MDERTEVLIREFADKLGVTVEHLWGAMLQQAVIAGTVSALGFVVSVAVIVGGYFFVRSRTTCNEGGYRHGRVADAGLEWFVYACSAVIATMAAFGTLYDALTAFLNPEYWALKQLLS